MELYWIWLSQIKGIGPVVQKKLIQKFGDPYEVYNAPQSEIINIKGIGNHAADLINMNKDLDHAQRILEKAQKEDIKLLTCNDELYPKEVKQIVNTPVLLYYKGNIGEESIGIGIVGSRRCSEYGKRVAKEAAEALAKNNIPVISGMAKGIDGYAHTACLKAGGHTIAILGSGLDICYPREHENLMKSIIERGAVISQYPPGTKPLAVNFPKRNFLISAWTKKLLVVEAGENSGALITAGFALKLGRKVYAVPNSIYARESMGTNKLIETGASIFLSPHCLLKGSTTAKVTNNDGYEDISSANTELSSLELKILSLLHDGAIDIGRIIMRTGEESSVILETLSMMELKGIISIISGNVQL